MEQVRTWMTSPAITITETMPLPLARRLLRECRIRRAPVVDPGGRLVGIITEGDINRVSDSHVGDVRDYDLYHRVADLPISVIMTRNVVTATPDMSIMQVAQLLLDHQIGGVPVIEDGQIVGMITESDLFRLIVRRQVGAEAESTPV
jgi:CBS domain-containing protein